MHGQKDGRKDGRTDRPYFIGPFQLPAGVQKEKKSYNKSVKLHFYYSTQKYDDSTTRYFPFSRSEFPQKSTVVFT